MHTRGDTYVKCTHTNIHTRASLQPQGRACACALCTWDPQYECRGFKIRDSSRKGVVQVTGQALFFLAFFMRPSREFVIGLVERVLPDRIPWLWDHMGYTSTPAEMLHNRINDWIHKFQESSVQQAAAGQLDQRCAFRPVKAHKRNLVETLHNECCTSRVAGSGVCLPRVESRQESLLN